MDSLNLTAYFLKRKMNSMTGSGRHLTISILFTIDCSFGNIGH